MRDVRTNERRPNLQIRALGGGATAALISGGRLHLQHGPIDLIIQISGTRDAVRRAHRLAAARFRTVLAELVAELPALRRPVAARCTFVGRTARRMWQAAHPLRDRFITPMAAVAGGVADEVLSAMLVDRDDLVNIIVNNGGDIALWNVSDTPIQVGILANSGVAQDRLGRLAKLRLDHDDGVGGIATSGWRGRSQSLGIADAVTVLAADAASADAAATLIANAVNVDSGKVRREPANGIQPDSDLGTRPVTTVVGELDDDECRDALRAGEAEAESMRRSGYIAAAMLTVREHFAICGDPGPWLQAAPDASSRARGSRR